MSPYLFIIIAEPLSTLFTHDSMHFTKVTKEDAYEIIKALNLYSKASGQRVNLSKSIIIFSKNYPHQIKQEITHILGIEECDKLGKYLGLAADWGRSKQQMLKDIVERVITKTKGWREKFLSQAGKEILIKSVLQAIPAYSMSILKYPSSMCKKISSQIARFWWANSKRDSGIHWFSWSSITHSKRGGGLGFKDINIMNQALLAKQS